MWVLSSVDRASWCSWLRPHSTRSHVRHRTAIGSHRKVDRSHGPLETRERVPEPVAVPMRLEYMGQSCSTVERPKREGTGLFRPVVGRDGKGLVKPYSCSKARYLHGSHIAMTIVQLCQRLRANVHNTPCSMHAHAPRGHGPMIPSGAAVARHQCHRSVPAVHATTILSGSVTQVLDGSSGAAAPSLPGRVLYVYLGRRVALSK